MWDERDGFYYDKLRSASGDECEFLRVRSMVGLMPLFACLVLEDENTECLKDFTKRTKWFLKNKPELRKSVSRCCSCSAVNVDNNGLLPYTVSLISSL